MTCSPGAETAPASTTIAKNAGITRLPMVHTPDWIRKS